MLQDIERLISSAPDAAPRRSEAIEKLAAAGIVGDAAQMLVGLGACDRDVARSKVAIRSAAEYVEGIMPSMPHDLNWVAHLWAALSIDAIGLGSTSTMPSDGGSTQRFPAFSACGKGRKQATDGGAWSAAIEEAARRVAQEAGVAFGWDVVTLEGDVYIRLVDALSGNFFFLAEDLFPPEWEAALAAYHLKLYHNGGVAPDQAQTFRDWAAMYNEAVANMRNVTASAVAALAADAV